MRIAYVITHEKQGVFVCYKNYEVMFCVDYRELEIPVSSFRSPQAAVEHIKEFWDNVRSGEASIKEFTFYPITMDGGGSVTSRDLTLAGVPIARR